MEKFVKGDVVVLAFPYTDFSNVKKRPALVIATLQGQNAILAQITSVERNDEHIVSLTKKDFQTGGINNDSFIMASLIFTVDTSRINYKAGKLTSNKIKQVEEKLCELFTK